MCNVLDTLYPVRLERKSELTVVLCTYTYTWESCAGCYYGDGVVPLYLWSFCAKVEGWHDVCYLAGCICRLFDLSFCCLVVFSLFRGEN